MLFRGTGENMFFSFSTFIAMHNLYILCDSMNRFPLEYVLSEYGWIR